MIKGIVFDLDGTLLDTLDDLTNAVNKLLANHNFPQHSKEKIKEMVGNGAVILLKRALPKLNFSNEEFNKIYNEYAKIYETSQEFTKIYDGIDEVLDYFIKNNIKIAILSNKPDKATKLCYKQYLNKWNFEPVFGQKDGFPIKPDPFMLNKIIEIWGFEKSQILFIGDSAEDMQTAKNAGVLGIGAGWGFRTTKILDNAGAFFSPKSTKELLKFIKSL